MSVTGLSHVGVSTPDLERAATFYIDVLGFAEVVRFSWEIGSTPADEGLGLVDTAADIAVLHAGNTYLELLQFRSPTPIRHDVPPTLLREGITHLGLDVGSPVEASALVGRSGGTEVVRANDASRSTRMVRDPDGNLLELRPGTATDPVGHARHITVPVSTRLADAAHGSAASGSPVTAFHHVGVCSLDADRQAEFYLAAGLSDVDDSTWTVQDDSGAEVRRRIRTLSFGNAYLELIEHLDEGVAPRPADARIIEYGFNHFCVDVDDITTTHPHLREAGMTVHASWTPMPGGNAAMGYGLDPTGLPIELLEHRTAKSTMWPGHLTLQR